MKLVLQHGYPHPYPEGVAAEQNDALFEKSLHTTYTIHGVVAFEWLHDITIEFGSNEQAAAVAEQTGWAVYSPRVLEAEITHADGYNHPAIIIGTIAYHGFWMEQE